MIVLRAAKDRGHFKNDWLTSHHTFSFGDYHDPEQMGFADLVVMNHDCVAPTKGFASHGHRDMEIITYVLHGAVEHQDSLGNKAQIPAGEVQVMSAGSGIRHSEFNPSDKDTLELYQIWIHPTERNLKPSYQQKSFTRDEKLNQFKLMASPPNEPAPLKIRQKARLWAAVLESSQKIEFQIKTGRKIWVQVVKGEVTVAGWPLEAGDGLAVSSEARLLFETESSSSEILVFDMGT